MFLVLQIPAFHVPGFTDSGFSCVKTFRTLRCSRLRHGNRKPFYFQGVSASTKRTGSLSTVLSQVRFARAGETSLIENRLNTDVFTIMYM